MLARLCTRLMMTQIPHLRLQYKVVHPLEYLSGSCGTEMITTSKQAEETVRAEQDDREPVAPAYWQWSRSNRCNVALLAWLYS
jgi:hypothetical protein